MAPLVCDDECFGVLELAFFNKIKKHEIELILKTAENIGSAVEKIKIRNQTTILLEQSKQFTEELQAQEEEIRQNMEELIATQEQMETKNSENEIKLKKALDEIILLQANIKNLEINI